MNNINYDNPKNSFVLYELGEKLNFLIELYNQKTLPRTLMISGNKGIGKFTLVNHFLNYVFDKVNYNLKEHIINSKTQFYKQYMNNVFPNIIYLSGEDFKNVNVDSIRHFKSIILKSTISKKERFIVLDDIELFNHNSLNALLKIIEEPISNNFFILINNKTKPLLDTIYSRSLEIKIFLNNELRIKIINSLIKKNNLDSYINFNVFNLTPGNFLIFNKIINENDINLDNDFLENLEILLNLYKKNKSNNLVNIILFLTDYYFYMNQVKKNSNFEKNIENKNFVIYSIRKFITHNLNQNSLINELYGRLSNG